MTNSTMSVLAIEKAVSVLRSGGVIALPTDTLYALAAAARDAEAVRRVFAIKGREGAKPLPLFVSDLAMAERGAVFLPTAHRLAERFWPGPLTIALPRQPAFESEALAGGDTVALRAPDHEAALAVIAALATPVTATSANRSGGRDPITPSSWRSTSAGVMARSTTSPTPALASSALPRRWSTALDPSRASPATAPSASERSTMPSPDRLGGQRCA